MSSHLNKALKKHAGKNLFQVKRRPQGVGRLTGFVMAWSESLVLFHQLDDNVFCLNGYSVINADDVSDYRVFDRDDYWQRRAVSLHKLKPVIPNEVSVTNWRELFGSVASHFPLVTLHTERRNPDVCYVGQVLKVSEATLTVRDLDCNCEWQKPRRLKLTDITRVEFGDGYSMSLAATSSKLTAR